jgi:hypothetical protein
VEILLWRSIWLLLVSRVVVIAILLIAEARIKASSAMIVGHGAFNSDIRGVDVFEFNVQSENDQCCIANRSMAAFERRRAPFDD